MLYVEQPVSVVNLVLAGIRTAVLASLCRIGVWSFAVFFDVFFPLEKNPVSHVAFTLQTNVSLFLLSICLFLLVSVALKLRSLRLQPPRLCRLAVSLKPIVSLNTNQLFSLQREKGGFY